jgi:hypothetical protein
LLALFSPLVAAAPISASENYAVSPNERDFLKEKIDQLKLLLNVYLNLKRIACLNLWENLLNFMYGTVL